MDILIFLGTLVAVLLCGFFALKLITRKRDSGRNAKHYSVPVDSRLKQRHTGRPHLRHQTFASKDQSDEIWKASRLKTSETRWEKDSFDATKISSDSEKTQDSQKNHQGLDMPSVAYVPGEPARRTAGAGSGKRSRH